MKFFRLTLASFFLFASFSVQSQSSMSYTYNSSNEVTSVQSSSWGTSKNYTYDLGGNRVGALDNSNSGTTFLYDSQSNRLINTTSVVEGVDGSTQSVSYDAMGNIVQTSLDIVTYGAGGRLAKWVSGGVTTKMYYNALGQRTKTIVLGGPNAGVFAEFYDPEGRLIGVYKDNGQGGYDVIEELIYLDNFRVVATVRPDSVLGMTDPKVYPILTDHLGVPRSILNRDTSQAVWEWKDYEAFGNQAPNELISGSRFVYNGRFPGQRFDESTGSLHNGFRTYNAKLGRYMQSDPLGLEAGWNTYAYVGNNPVEWMDPWGLEKMVLFGQNEKVFQQGSKNHPDNPNTWNIYGHGGYAQPGGAPIMRDGNSNISPLQLLDKMKKEGWSGEPIVLYSCMTGAPNKNNVIFAQELSNLSKVPVSAPDTLIWYNSQIGPYDMANKIPYTDWKNPFSSGTMRNFKPKN